LVFLTRSKNAKGDNNFFMNYILPIALLIASNIAMTFAWYGHLKYLEKRSLIAAILIS